MSANGPPSSDVACKHNGSSGLARKGATSVPPSTAVASLARLLARQAAQELSLNTGDTATNRDAAEVGTVNDDGDKNEGTR